MAKQSKHQDRIIKRFYDNRGAISLQRVQELLTEIYLSEGKRREQQWKLMVSHLETLGAPKARLDRIVESKDVGQLAKLVEELVKKG